MKRGIMNMLKIRISYMDAAEKDKLINKLKNDFKVLPESKLNNGKGPYKKTYIDISTK